jgi:hypothetical protein
VPRREKSVDRVLERHSLIKHRIDLPPAAHELIDEFMPIYDVSEYHETTVRAPINRVYDSVRTADLNRSLIVRLLVRLRGLPHSLSRGNQQRRPNLNLDALMKSGFVLLGEHHPNEIVLGLIGRFWTPAGGRCRVKDAEAFRDFDQSGYAKAVWNFSLVEDGPTATRLATETRVRCLDDGSRRRFRLYWTVIAPFSGLIRREVLRAIRRSSESKL